MAAGAGLWLLAIVATAGHFAVVFGLTPLAARLPRTRFAPSRLRLVYLDGRGVLREVLTACAAKGFTIAETRIDQQDTAHDPRTVVLSLTVEGSSSIADLTATLAEIDGVTAVDADDGNVTGD
jgi:putative Mg2+ transporter-C (MgtC) family protein